MFRKQCVVCFKKIPFCQACYNNIGSKECVYNEPRCLECGDNSEVVELMQKLGVYNNV